MPEGVSFGLWLRQRRRERDMTQEELASEVGCSAVTIRKIENDERRPSRQVAKLLAESLDIPSSYYERFVRFAREGTRDFEAETPDAVLEPGQQPAPGRGVPGPTFPPDTDLPTPLTPLIGRETEVTAITHRLLGEDRRLLTLVGPPGIGKTRLAVEVARRLRGGSEGVGADGEDRSYPFQDGIYFVELASVKDKALVLGEIAAALDVRESRGLPPDKLLDNWLHGKAVLLVLDNFEQVVGAAAEVAGLLSRNPGASALVTSREALKVQGEYLYIVPSLAVPEAKQSVGRDEVGRFSAVELFVQRAQAAGGNFELTDENVAAIAAICRRLDGLPLPIELVAARTRLLRPEQLLGRLNSSLSLLKGSLRDLPERHRTLHNAIEWSYDLLSEPEKQLLRRLSVFASGWTLEAAEAVAGVGTLNTADGQGLSGDPTSATIQATVGIDVLTGLSSLLDKSLLRQVAAPGVGEARFSMLETIGEYALNKLAENGELAALRLSHASYYASLAERAEPHLGNPDGRHWLDTLEAEHDNLRAALNWSLGCGKWEIAARLGNALYRFWWLHGHLSEGRQWLARISKLGFWIAERSGKPDPAVEHPKLRLAKVLGGEGLLAGRQGDYSQAVSLLNRSLDLQSELGDEAGEAATLNSLGNIAIEQCDYREAKRLHERSLDLKRRIGDLVGMAASLNNLGLAALESGNMEDATSLLEESLALKRELGDRRGIAVSLNNLGMLAMHGGEMARAEMLCRESLALAREAGDKVRIAYALNNLGYVALKMEESGQAAPLFRESLQLKWELGDKEAIAWTLEGLAGVSTLDGQAHRAARLFGVAEALRELISAPLRPVERLHYEKLVQATRLQLPPESFSAAWSAGRALPLEQAIEEALRVGTGDGRRETGDGRRETGDGNNC